MIGFLKTTIIGGLLFLVPFAVLIVVLEKTIAVVGKVINPLAAHIPVRSMFGLNLPIFVALALIVAMCFAAGLLARTNLARRAVYTLEGNILDRLPGYAVLKSMSEEIADSEEGATNSVVLIRFDDAWQVGLKIEELDGGAFTAVFIPDSPTPQTGAVLIVGSERITPTELSIMAAFRCMKGRGAGIGNLIKL